MGITRRAWIRERIHSHFARRRNVRNSTFRDRFRDMSGGFEDLEGRTLLATINVGSTADVANYPIDVRVSGLTDPSKITIIDAIHAANNTGGRDTIVLQKLTYNLDQVDNYWYGPNGLPAISTRITIQGNGATIERTGGANFRFFYVSSSLYGGLPNGDLTLRALTLKGGVAQGGASYYGGGGLGAGGAIFNQGTLTLDSVLLTSNTAQGGRSGYDTSAHAGGGIGQDAQDQTPGGFGGPLPGNQNFQTGGPKREGQGGGNGLITGFGGGGSANGGSGGFGGGGGSVRGHGGFGGGSGESSTYSDYGGGGAGLGGAIFNRRGRVNITNSTIAENAARGGYASYYSTAGSGFGGGIFNLNGSIRLVNATIANNQLSADGKGDGGRTDGYQVYNLANTLWNAPNTATANASLRMGNTIMAGAPSGGHDIVNQTFLNDAARQNQAVVRNAPGISAVTNVVPSSIPNLDSFFGPGGRGYVNVGVIAKDPQLGDLQDNGGWSNTMAIAPDSPARGIGATVVVRDVKYDQRGAIYTRSTSGRIDAGAYQVQYYTQYSPLARLAYFDPVSQQFLPFQASHTILNSKQTPVNVYVISHGWMPGLDTWANDTMARGDLPLSWQTWQGPNAQPASSQSTPWLFRGSDTGNYNSFPINESGLAQEILKADPNARVLAFSWIDESATPTGIFGIPKDAFQSEGHTTMAGMQMAQATMEALAPTYFLGSGKVHMIGHSHGSRVATVAAVALQQAAQSNSRFNVVGQLTVLDSPEDNHFAYPDSSRNPITYQDSANFAWFYLAQLNPAKKPAGNAVDPIFVDNYISYFGSDFGNFNVQNKDQGISKSLNFVYDVRLDPYPIFQNTVFNISQKHQYPANWYAGSVTSKGTSSPTGLYWSPLIAGSSTPPRQRSSQLWNPVGSQTQFVLSPTSNNPPDVTPAFAKTTFVETSTQGSVVTGGSASGVTSVGLNESNGPVSTFQGTLNKASGVVGFSFDYNFASAADPGAQLQILINGNLYFAMSAGLARSGILPGSDTFSATFGLGSESDGVQSIQIRLAKGNNPNRFSSVAVTNFHVFSL